MFNNNIFCIYFNICLSIILGSCSNNLNKITKQANMLKQLNYTNKFIITSYIKSEKLLDPNQPLFIYIEGDGKAWKNKYQLSDNPTPSNPLTLKLAAIDPNPNVIYIARPCQFTSLSLDQNCNSKYWSTARYSKEVVDSIDQVIDNFKKIVDQNNLNTLSAKIHLIGYSGGATIAELIAAKRKDILSIRTIAGNLDHDAVSDWHQTTKLDQSLNPINFINQLKNIPQMHYIGSNDQIIAPEIIKNFSDQINIYNKDHKICSYYKIIDNFDHYHGWEAFWRQELNYIPSCIISLP